jgi:tRNA-specific 2-thiouridylase
VTLRLWIDPAAPNGDRACCAPSAVRSARETCHERGVPHVALDLRDAFRGAVVDPFVASYARGATPNPCVRCNGVFRFDALARFADAVGARELHTGHYARIARLDGVPLVARGVDARKDQSYMLATVEPALLERLRFPLGDRTKDESRARARELGLAAAEARESQEVCFLGGGDYRTFLSRQGVAGTPGAIVDEAGATLGRHAGVEGFTTGQRRGLGIAAPEPLYVVRTEPERGAVVVGPRRSLGRRRVLLDDARLYVRRERVEAKLRYRSPGVPARVAPSSGGRLRLDLEREVFAVAHGQTAALYEGDVVVGAGVVAADGVAA